MYNYITKHGAKENKYSSYGMLYHVDQLIATDVSKDLQGKAVDMV